MALEFKVKRPQSKPAKPKLPAAKARSKAVRSTPSRTASKAPPPAQKKSSRKPAPAPIAEPRTKQAQLITLLGSDAGASMAQMTELTGWLPHTVRGMLSGSLRKRLGLNVQHSLQDGVRVYRIVPAGEAVAQ